jgi:hypothetical protein
MESLPVELLKIIYSELRIKERRLFCCVCKLWKSIAYQGWNEESLPGLQLISPIISDWLLSISEQQKRKNNKIFSIDRLFVINQQLKIKSAIICPIKKKEFMKFIEKGVFIPPPYKPHSQNNNLSKEQKRVIADANKRKVIGIYFTYQNSDRLFYCDIQDYLFDDKTVRHALKIK